MQECSNAGDIGGGGRAGGRSGDGLRGALLAVRSLVPVAGVDECREERMGARRLRFELRVKLNREIPRMPGQLGNLDELSVRRASRNPETVLGERAFVQTVELVAVARPLRNRRHAVDALGEGPR